ncbi:hypothetical protein PoB_003593300 [Plakobranchus ocellatus]|uniref:Uncharacterized protein n=1 Tax=Plakobranchus ocellatus TaxID=259542 RepID=A0AAV4APZ9_9GAST|nr:hypothetical protein PoB_003593300 [Plakobranchus ocellatus]
MHANNQNITRQPSLHTWPKISVGRRSFPMLPISNRLYAKRVAISGARPDQGNTSDCWMHQNIGAEQSSHGLYPTLRVQHAAVSNAVQSKRKESDEADCAGGSSSALKLGR